MEDLILGFFAWSNQSIDTFFLTFSLLWFFFFFLLSFARFFLTKKWLQLYKDVYSKYIVFEDIGIVPGSLTSLQKNRLPKIIGFSLFFLLIYFLGANKIVSFIVEKPFYYFQIGFGFLLGEIYILLDFLFGIFLFLFVRRHSEDISGTVYFKKNIVAALRILGMSQRFLYFLLLTIFIPTYYMYGLLFSLGLNYVSILLFGYVSRIE